MKNPLIPSFSLPLRWGEAAFVLPGWGISLLHLGPLHRGLPGSLIILSAWSALAPVSCGQGELWTLVRNVGCEENLARWDGPNNIFILMFIFMFILMFIHFPHVHFNVHGFFPDLPMFLLKCWILRHYLAQIIEVARSWMASTAI